jgi:hypothetical protein
MEESNVEVQRLDLLWGAGLIGKEIGRTPRQTYHLLESRALPARKIGGRWCVDRNVLRSFFANWPKAQQAGVHRYE